MPVIYFSGATPIRTDRSSNFGPGTRFSLLHTCLDRIWDPPSLQFNGHQGYTPGIKRQERNVYHSPPSSAEVESEWSYTSAPHLCLHCVYGTTLLLSFTPQLARRGRGKLRKTSVRIAVIWPNFETKHISNTSLFLQRTAVWKTCRHHYVQI